MGKSVLSQIMETGTLKEDGDAPYSANGDLFWKNILRSRTTAPEKLIIKFFMACGIKGRTVKDVYVTLATNIKAAGQEVRRSGLKTKLISELTFLLDGSSDVTTEDVQDFENLSGNRTKQALSTVLISLGMPSSLFGSFDLFDTAIKGAAKKLDASKDGSDKILKLAKLLSTTNESQEDNMKITIKDKTGKVLHTFEKEGATVKMAVEDACEKGINLGGADLSDADLMDAFLADADLSGADLSDADLTDAIFDGANLKGTNFTDAYFKGATFANVITDSKTKGLPQKYCTYGSPGDLQESLFKGPDEFTTSILDLCTALGMPEDIISSKLPIIIRSIRTAKSGMKQKSTIQQKIDALLAMIEQSK